MLDFEITKEIQVDVLVIGAGISGTALAEKCAALGKKVLLCDSRTYPLHELGVWHRPWVVWEDSLSGSLLENPAIEKNAPGELVPLVPDQYKLYAEDRLLSAGVKILYNVSPVSMTPGDEGYTVLLGAKSGLFTVRTRKVLDNTQTAVLSYASRVAPDKSYSYGIPGALTYTAELWDIPEDFWENPPDITLPEGSGIQSYTYYPSAFSPRNMMLEIQLPMHSGQGREANAEATRKAKEEMLHLLRYLLKSSGWHGTRIGSLAAQPMPLKDLKAAELIALAEKAVKDFLQGATYLFIGCFAPEYGDVKEAPSLPKEASLRWGSGGDSMLESQVRESIAELQQVEVAVCGGGPSGATAACAAAEQGATTALLEMNDILGGAGTAGGVHYYWYGYRRGFTKEIDDTYYAFADALQQPREFYVWGERDSWNPDLKAEVLQRRCQEKQVQVFTGGIVCGSFIKGNTVVGILVATPYGAMACMAKVVVDTTGDGDVALLAGAPFVEGNEKDAMVMWAVLAQYTQAGRYRGGIFTTTVDVGSPYDYTRFILSNRRRGTEGTYDHGTYLAPRESRHLLGEHIITVKDIINEQTYDDTILVCFSNYDTKGKSWADIVYAGFLPGQFEIHVPYRSLLAPGLEGLLVGGRALSCTHDASSAIRMQDDMQNLGGAIGYAAALAVRSGSVRNLPMGELHRLLIAKGALLELPTSGNNVASPEELQEIVSGLTGHEPWEVIDMDMESVSRGRHPITAVLLAPPQVAVPLLEKQYKQATHHNRLTLARLLLWHESDIGIEDILEEMQRMLRAEVLPTRKGSVKFCQPHPDHGIMAEFTYLMNLLAKSKDIRVPQMAKTLADRIQQSTRDYIHREQCIFGHIESVAYVASRRASAVFLPALQIVLALEEFQQPVLLHGAPFDLDITKERISYLALLLAEAVARCGGSSGYHLLAEFLFDQRRILAASAERLLRELTGWENLAVDTLYQRSKKITEPTIQPYRKELW